MWDVWLGEVNLTLLVLALSVLALFPLQLWLCCKVKPLWLRLMPVGLLAMAAMLCIMGWASASGWDTLGWLILAIEAGFMLLACGAAWGVWAVVWWLRARRGAC